MKLILITEDRGKLVEFTRKEWHEFALLVKSIEGKTESEAHWGFQQFLKDDESFQEAVDMSGVFGAILAFYKAKFRANEIQLLLDQIKEFLNEKPK